MHDPLRVVGARPAGRSHINPGMNTIRETMNPQSWRGVPYPGSLQLIEHASKASFGGLAMHALQESLCISLLGFAAIWHAVCNTCYMHEFGHP
jgi:hypothetical protein